MASDLLTKQHARMLHVAGALRSAGKALSEEALVAEWQSVDAARRRAEAPVLYAVEDFFEAQKTELVAQLSAELRTRSGVRSATKRGIGETIVEAIFNAVEWSERIRDAIQPGLLDALREGFRAGAMRVSLSSNFRESARTQAVLESVLRKAEGVNETTAGDLADAIQAGLRENESIGAIRRRVASYFDDIQDWRAQLIAQTSVTPAFETAQQEAFTAAGIDRNRWFSQRDGDVRPTHYEADGQVRDVGTAFSVGEAQLEFPGDPEGPAREVVGCRCTLFPVIGEEDDEDGQRSWRERRNEAIRAAYPAMRKEHGKWGAMGALGKKHDLSEHTIHDIVYEKGHYSA